MDTYDRYIKSDVFDHYTQGGYALVLYKTVLGFFEVSLNERVLVSTEDVTQARIVFCACRSCMRPFK